MFSIHSPFRILPVFLKNLKINKLIQFDGGLPSKQLLPLQKGQSNFLVPNQRDLLFVWTKPLAWKNTHQDSLPTKHTREILINTNRAL